MPRFVLLFHECPPDYRRGSHWDLMLEAGDVLRTWALAQLPRYWQAAHQETAKSCAACPALAAGNAVDAELLGDHRPAYLDYQGPVSGERGHVTRVEAGTYTMIGQRADGLDLAVTGCSLHGRITLSRLEPNGARWLLTYRPAPPHA